MGYNPDQAAPFNGGEVFSVKLDGGDACTAQASVSGAAVTDASCTTCDALWDLQLDFGAGEGTLCADYGFASAMTVYSRKMGYAASMEVDGTTQSDVVVAYDLDSSQWRAIGTWTFNSPNPMNYELWAGEPTWEH